MVIDFNSETQSLVLKQEYSLVETVIEMEIPAYAGVMLNEIRRFDPINTQVEEYEYYYYRGFHFIFDILDKI